MGLRDFSGKRTGVQMLKILAVFAHEGASFGGVLVQCSGDAALRFASRCHGLRCRASTSFPRFYVSLNYTLRRISGGLFSQCSTAGNYAFDVDPELWITWAPRDAVAIGKNNRDGQPDSKKSSVGGDK
jgi:hypothetical protein